MKLVVKFNQAITGADAVAFRLLMEQEVKTWGGFRGKAITHILVALADLGCSERVYLEMGYSGPPEGEEEIIEAVRDTIMKTPRGIGDARVKSVQRP